MILFFLNSSKFLLLIRKTNQISLFIRVLYEKVLRKILVIFPTDAQIDARLPDSPVELWRLVSATKYLRICGR